MQMVCPDHDPNSQGTGVNEYGPGESFYEPPGCHHVRSENASDTEEATFIANLVQERKIIEELGPVAALVVIDAEVEEKKAAKAKV
jgi:hypothetical protein